MTLLQHQREFIDAELFQLTLGAVARRGRVYRSGLSEDKRRPVHDSLRELLLDLSRQYETAAIGDDRHRENIGQIAETVTTRHTAVLHEDRFRIGSAQKALNLYLKYRWCLGKIPMPPHCPFDAYVLRAIPGWKTRSWTALDSIEEYADLVAAARAVAGDQSLAHWELTVYNAIRRPDA